MKLRAPIRTINNATRHMVGGRELPPPAYVEIHPTNGAFYLFYFTVDGVNQADTWHETVDDAKAQANFEFSIEESDWKPIE
jgi:hypothetical protein